MEKLASIDRVDAFLEVVDSDDFGKAAALLKEAGIDSKTRALVLEKMAQGGGEYE